MAVKEIGRKAKVIFVYSGKGGVGKSYVTANLARAMVKRGQKVLVVDADFLTPSQNSYFKSEHPNKNIDVVSNGFRKGLPSVFVDSAKIREFTEEVVDAIVKKDYGYVLVDCPPSLTELHNILFDRLKVSGVLIVSQPSRLSMNDVEGVLDVFRLRRIPIIGLVLNMDCEEIRSEFKSDIPVLGCVDTT